MKAKPRSALIATRPEPGTVPELRFWRSAAPGCAALTLTRFLAAVLLPALVVTSAAVAQQIPLAVAGVTRARGEQTQGPGPFQPKPARQPTPAISSEQVLYLVRATLLTLNDANRSGNYTVLRDLAAPDFQAKNSAADLAQSFADLRRRNFDLFAVALLAPQFANPPALDASGKLRLTGFFPTRPLRISFDLIFQSVNGQWRVFGISVSTPEAPATQSQLERQSPKHSSPLFYGFRILSGTGGVRW